MPWHRFFPFISPITNCSVAFKPVKSHICLQNIKTAVIIHRKQSTSALSCFLLRACRGQLKRDGTRAETRFRLSAKQTSPFKSARASVQTTTGSRSVRISGSNAGYTMFRGSVKGTGYPLHSPFSPSLPLPCVTVCRHISTGVYHVHISNSCSSLKMDALCNRNIRTWNQCKISRA